MAATFKTESHGGSATTSLSTVISKPIGTVDGDLLIAVLGNTRSALNATINSVPSGWTLIDVGIAETGTTPTRLYTYYKIASSEPSDWTWGWNASIGTSWGCYRIDGYATTGYILANASIGVDNSTSPSYANTITPSTSNSLLLMSIWASTTSLKSISSQAITTSNPTWTEVAEQSNDTGGGTLALAWAVRPETTATGNSTATISGAGVPVTPSVCSIIAIKRITDFTVTIEDTVSNSEMIVMQKALMGNQTDTISLSDSIEVTKGREWKKANKPSTTWTNKLK